MVTSQAEERLLRRQRACQFAVFVLTVVSHWIFAPAGVTVPGFTNLGGQDGFLLVLDDSGNRILNINFGDRSNDAAFDIALDGAGGIYITGTCYKQAYVQLARVPDLIRSPCLCAVVQVERPLPSISRSSSALTPTPSS
jgi:hypothetical protein